eukprot:CAMPEP_0182908586 /NCGR_PEP_ID=MMETSP0034_2-20130328/35289_1 /TAXON_ID=156128 /ORGANISM="Nephroselmis pyriformis, Strain CCMP717" /LENGTH=405 /DNA_ID=CAMNT_0025044775 /DNA_START=267 /DNA_END=1485 /DNA_ORIENTATION=+
MPMMTYVALAFMLFVPMVSYYMMHSRLVERHLVLERALVKEAQQVSDLRAEVRELAGIKHQLELATRAMAAVLKRQGGTTVDAISHTKTVSAQGRVMREASAEEVARAPDIIYKGTPMQPSPAMQQASTDGEAVNPMLLKDEDIYGSSEIHTPLSLPGGPNKCNSEFWTGGIPPVYGQQFRWREKPGVYVEVGAGDGVFSSNTYFFEAHLCWTGLAFEPTRNEFIKLQNNRPKTTAINGAVCNLGGLGKDKRRDFSDVTLNGLWTGWSGFEDSWSPEVSNEVQSKVMGGERGWEKEVYPVDCYTLAETTTAWLGDVKHVDFMSVAVQGYELEVLRSHNFEAVPVDVVQVESRHGREEVIEDFMRARGFKASYRPEPGHKDAVFVRNGFVPAAPAQDDSSWAPGVG